MLQLRAREGSMVLRGLQIMLGFEDFPKASEINNNVRIRALNACCETSAQF